MSWRTSTFLVLCCTSFTRATLLRPNLVSTAAETVSTHPVAAETRSTGQQTEKITRLQKRVARLSTALLNQTKTTLRLGGIIKRQEEHAKHVDTLLKSLSDRQSAFDELATESRLASESRLIEPHSSASAAALSLAATPELVELPGVVPMATTLQTREIDADHGDKDEGDSDSKLPKSDEPEIILPDDSPMAGNRKSLLDESIGDMEEDNKVVALTTKEEDIMELPEPLVDDEEKDPKNKSNPLTTQKTVTLLEPQDANESPQKPSPEVEVDGTFKQNLVTSKVDTSKVAKALREEIEKAKAENNKTALKEKLAAAKKFLEDNLKALQNQTNATHETKTPTVQTDAKEQMDVQELGQSPTVQNDAKEHTEVQDLREAKEDHMAKHREETEDRYKAEDERKAKYEQDVKDFWAWRQKEGEHHEAIATQANATQANATSADVSVTNVTNVTNAKEAEAATGNQIVATTSKKHTKGAKVDAADKKPHRKKGGKQNLQESNAGDEPKAYGRGGDHDGNHKRIRHKGHRHRGPILTSVNKANAGMLVASRPADAAIEATIAKLRTKDSSPNVADRFPQEERLARQRLSENTLAKSIREEFAMEPAQEALKGVASTDDDIADLHVSTADRALLDESFQKLREMLRGAQSDV